MGHWMSAAKALLFYLQEENRDRIKSKTKQKKTPTAKTTTRSHRIVSKDERPIHATAYAHRQCTTYQSTSLLGAYCAVAVVAAAAAGVGVQCASRENDEPFKLSTA